MITSPRKSTLENNPLPIVDAETHPDVIFLDVVMDDSNVDEEEAKNEKHLKAALKSSNVEIPKPNFAIDEEALDMYKRIRNLKNSLKRRPSLPRSCNKL